MTPEESSATKLVYERLKPFRPEWPATFEETASDPVLARVLLTLAKHPESLNSLIDRSMKVNLQVDISKRAEFEGANFENPPTEPTPSPVSTHHLKPAPTLDRKSLAAGEKPDKD